MIPAPELPLLLVIAGPTASGKTELAIHAARRFGTHILSFDSRQFYREMHIGTAVPGPEQLQAAPHHFIQHISIHQEYNIARYREEALALTSRLFREHRVVVAVGGSGLYLQALVQGLDDLPEPEPGIRAQIHFRLSHHGLQDLVKQLRELDPEACRRIDLANPRRVQRALEVCLQTGQPYSTLLGKRRMEVPFRWHPLVISMPRPELYHRIDARVLRMMDEGLEEEARSLYAFRELRALSTVGYKELFHYFDGNCSRGQAMEEIQKNTRRFAKRQTTWFGRFPDYSHIAPGELDAALDRLSLD
ncbi:MAG TPA: tRNA (adenosine(37)-N6)-dimethylallyltransferase MiaA [Bacteroidales bacterium]|nr:tRNA (adenosine(37)-N6)-dimethylallyltransferase MiaA [Bacteroidales bacterium]HRZ76534.1 tRNA (adenosine(37)-N6)-dimethylallyltransferase MiaA [Bacteroidales bacterium]